MGVSRRLWWAIGSSALVLSAAFAPWVTRLGHTVNGPDDEVAAVVVSVALVGLLLYVVTRNAGLAIVPLLAGMVTVIVVADGIHDPAGPFGGPGRNVHVAWGMWVALGGSVSLVVASVALLRDRRGRARPHATLLRSWVSVRAGLARLRRARIAGSERASTKRVAAEMAASERDERKEFAEKAARMTPYLAVEHEGSLYVLPTRQRSGIKRFSDSRWKDHRHLERAVTALWQLGVELPGPAFVDVGANIGTTTVPALAKYGFTSGYAFEPQPENYRLLRANLAANGLQDAVRAFNVAVTGREGTGVLTVRKPHLLEGGRPHAPGKRETVTVPLTTLDALVENGSLDPEAVGLLWLDIEGHELPALQGARSLRARSVPIVMEFDSRHMDAASIAVLRDLLAEHYTGMVDLSKARVEVAPNVLPLSALEQIAQRHRGTFTDLLAFRSPG